MSADNLDMDGGPVSADEIGRIGLFLDLGEEERAAIASVCRKRRFAAGQLIISDQEADHDVYFMLEGSADVQNHTIIGDALKLDQLGAGAYFGELSALDGGPRSAEVLATDNCIVAAMAPSDFRNMLSEYPSVLVLVLHNLAVMIRHSNLTVLQHATI
ncbi:cyclic nucleotide-binding domain-containing protein [uncultured Nisaea sp.]|jgi:CRP-like cAMP-binding protein|uniref:cyclic nucleotide-binding domain-containing protein n=1 Tax=uncultured Nisaea sp. TaxID=538215 RepID=UPI0030ECC3BA|tara:strand:- start:903 stop:1376 length:474 start_codon:yes stop_codon:yes gene_type:complete